MRRGRPWGCSFVLAILAATAWFGWQWIERHPEHNPYAPFRLAHPLGYATPMKLQALVAAPPACRAALTGADIAFTTLRPTSGGDCPLGDRTVLAAPASTFATLRPARPAATCAVAAALILWQREAIGPAAQRHFGQKIVAIDHLGTANCRRIGGGSGGRWSEHATGNAIDIAAFRLTDGRRISVLADWHGDPAGAAFLRDVRDGGCDLFGTVLSPDYNAAHRDHFHLDMAARMGSGVCR